MQICVICDLPGGSCRPVILCWDREEQDRRKNKDENGHCPAQPSLTRRWRDLRFCMRRCRGICYFRSHDLPPLLENQQNPSVIGSPNERPEVTARASRDRVKKIPPGERRTLAPLRIFSMPPCVDAKRLPYFGHHTNCGKWFRVKISRYTDRRANRKAAAAWCQPAISCL